MCFLPCLASYLMFIKPLGPLVAPEFWVGWSRYWYQASRFWEFGEMGGEGVKLGEPDENEAREGCSCSRAGAGGIWGKNIFSMFICDSLFSLHNGGPYVWDLMSAFTDSVPWFLKIFSTCTIVPYSIYGSDSHPLVSCSGMLLSLIWDPGFLS